MKNAIIKKNLLKKQVPSLSRDFVASINSGEMPAFKASSASSSDTSLTYENKKQKMRHFFKKQTK